MRVVNSALSRNFTRSTNSVHSDLNRSMNRVSSGRQYDTAAENPLVYYEGKKMDNEFMEAEARYQLITDLENRVYQQELGARTVQAKLTEARGRVEFIRNDADNGLSSTISTTHDELYQEAQFMANALNGQYEDYYIFGGNDFSTAPFILSDDGMTLTYSHTFSGESKASVITMEMKNNGSGNFEYAFSITDPPASVSGFTGEDQALKALGIAMKEQGRVDVGYGTISERDTLLDTYTGGMNVLTGLSSDAMKAGISDQELRERLNNSPIGLISQAIGALNEYSAGGDKSVMSSRLGEIMTKMTETEHNVSTVYSDLGNKYALLEDTADKLSQLKLSLQTQYKEKLGADPYESITAMYSNQYAYNAALQVGSRLMQSSLFDFVS